MLACADLKQEFVARDNEYFAKELAEENKLGGLVDVGVFEEAGRIEAALRRGEVKEALSWCAENKNALKKTNVGLMRVLKTGKQC